MTDIIPVEDEREHKRKAALLKAIGLDKVPAEQREIALAIAKRYELDLLLKHLVLIDGKPYVTRDGLLHIAHRSGQLDGIEVTDPEVVTLPGVGDFWRAHCSVYRKDMTRPFVYAGRYPTKGGNTRFAPEMAVKVAEVMSLRRAFDVSAPVIEERWDIDVPAVAEQPTITEQIAAKRRTISGPTSHRATVEGPVVDSEVPMPRDVRPGQEEVGQDFAPTDEPPLPVEPAGARADTSPLLASSPDSGNPVPASVDAAVTNPPAASTDRCEGFDPELGACSRLAGHQGPHNNKNMDSWK